MLTTNINKRVCKTFNKAIVEIEQSFLTSAEQQLCSNINKWLRIEKK